MEKGKSIRISLVQPEIFFEQKDRNLKQAEAVIKEEVKAGTDLVLLPEMSFTGYSMDTRKVGEVPVTQGAGSSVTQGAGSSVTQGAGSSVTQGAETPVTQGAETPVTQGAGSSVTQGAEASVGSEQTSTLNRVRDLARRYGLAIGFGWVALPPGDLAENRYTIVDREGRVVNEFTKLHPFSYAGEDRYFRGGAGPVRYEMSGIPFTTMICYDLRFPEEFREVAGDVHAAVIPANWPASRSEHWKTLLRARAIENQIYIFAVNCVGIMDGQEYSGDSCVICPDGRVADMLSGKAGVLRYRFTDDTEAYREAFPVLKDRRTP